MFLLNLVNPKEVRFMQAKSLKLSVLTPLLSLRRIKQKPPSPVAQLVWGNLMTLHSQ